MTESSIECERYDRVDLSGASRHRTENGWLRMSAVVTRPGIARYRTRSGQEIRELRPRASLESREFLDSLGGIPLTVGHHGMVTPQTFKRLSVGHLGTDARMDDSGDVVATVFITDPDAISRVESGGLSDFSLGYRMRQIVRSGREDGEDFDAVQDGHRANHGALLPPGDARIQGSSLRFDSEGTLIEIGESEMSENMQNFTDTGPDIDVKAIAKLESGKQQLQTRCDAMESELEELRKAKAEAEDQTRFDSAVESEVQARFDVVTACAIMGESSLIKIRSAGSSHEMRAKALELYQIDSSNKSEDWVEARFDGLIERISAESRTSARNQTHNALANTTSAQVDDDIYEQANRGIRQSGKVE